MQNQHPTHYMVTVDNFLFNRHNDVEALNKNGFVLTTVEMGGAIMSEDTVLHSTSFTTCIGLAMKLEINGKTINYLAHLPSTLHNFSAEKLKSIILQMINDIKQQIGAEILIKIQNEPILISKNKDFMGMIKNILSDAIESNGWGEKKINVQEIQPAYACFNVAFPVKNGVAVYQNEQPLQQVSFATSHEGSILSAKCSAYIPMGFVGDYKAYILYNFLRPQLPDRMWINACQANGFSLPEEMKQSGVNVQLQFLKEELLKHINVTKQLSLAQLREIKVNQHGQDLNRFNTTMLSPRKITAWTTFQELVNRNQIKLLNSEEALSHSYIPGFIPLAKHLSYTSTYPNQDSIQSKQQFFDKIISKGRIIDFTPLAHVVNKQSPSQVTDIDKVSSTNVSQNKRKNTDSEIDPKQSNKFPKLTRTNSSSSSELC